MLFLLMCLLRVVPRVVPHIARVVPCTHSIPIRVLWCAVHVHLSKRPILTDCRKFNSKHTFVCDLTPLQGRSISLGLSMRSIA